jgi:hypothetical protein
MLVLAVAGVARAQGRWEYTPVTPAEFETYSPQVAIDRWGTTHLMYSTRDPNRSGLQLFYTHDAGGRFAAPIQVTDTGTVFDSTNAELSSFAFRLDTFGVVHVTFVANVENHLRLYYTNNAKGHFDDAYFLAERTRYGMAVDSIGNAHVVWAIEAANGVALRYWSSLAPDIDYDAGMLPCSDFRYGCRIGDIEVESGPRGVIAAVAADSGSIHTFPITVPGTRQRVAIPGYDQYRTMLGLADLRFRMALDAEGAIHLVVPRVRQNGQHYLLYANNASSIFTTSLLVDSLPLQPRDFSFDLVFNGTDRFAAVWSSGAAQAASTIGRTGLVEITRPTRTWTMQTPIADLETRLVNGRGFWKRAMRVAMRGERISVAALARPDDQREEIVAVVTRSGLRPSLSYLLPDAAAAEMTVVVDAIAPYREEGSFGADGFHGDTVALQLRNPADSARVVVGPSVVSWDGRLVSSMLFIRRGAAPGPVPLAVRLGVGPKALLSNADTFFIVTPQHLGGAVGALNGGGVLGSGGRFGTRSKRGVLVVDSLDLRAGVYRIDTNDIDPITPGNQGFLPVTILSRGPIRIDSGAVLTVSAAHDTVAARYGSAGPGGGGGGSGGWRVAGGTGFTGGAGPSLYGEGPIGASPGSGPNTQSSRWGGGLSLNWTPGGLGFPLAAGGGGTGHPFGASGTFGRSSKREPSGLDSGGYGGAAAGSQALLFDGPTTGGGGGGHALRGESGNDHNEVPNGGAAVGSRPLVPLAGGSGGGGGGFSTNGIASGGGGGGAIAIFGFSDVTIAGQIRADGAGGIGDIPMTNSSGGGGGAGGGIVIGAKGAVRFVGGGSISARGGNGGVGHSVGARNGGRGGDGRIRIDGRAVGTVASRTTPRAAYSGPSTGTNGSVVARTGDTLRGSGEPGRIIRLFIRGENGRWNYRTPIDVRVAPDSTWKVLLGPDAAVGKLYIATMQEVAAPTNGGFTSEPHWVMSAAAGNILGQPSMLLSKSSHRYDCIKYTERDTATIVITNTGTLSDLEIEDVRIGGSGSTAFVRGRDYRGVSIPPGESMPLTLIFAPRDTGIFKATVTIVTNAEPEGTATVTLEACALAGTLVADAPFVDLGAVCVGDTVYRSVVITNVGDEDVVVEEIRGDEGILDISLVGRLPGFVIPPGKSETLALRFIVHRIDGELRLRIESDGSPRNLDIPVRLRDGRPQPRVDATPVVFRTLDVSRDDTCASETIWIHNASTTDALVIASGALVPPAPFALRTPLAGRSIAPGDSLSVELGFCTSSAGEHSANLELIFGRSNCSSTSRIPISGSATSGAADLQLVHPPDSAIELYQTLVGATSPRDSIVVVNEGNVAARLMPATITPLDGALAGEFAIEEPTDRDVAPGERVVYYVTFSPAAAGRRNADVNVGSEDGAWQATVHLMGTGTLPGIGLKNGELRFGDVHVDSTRTLTLEVFNNGTARDEIISMTAPGDPFAMVSIDRALPFFLEPNDTVRAVVSYTPRVERRDSLVLEIAAASQAKPIALVLSGRGVQEHAVAIDDSVHFGSNVRNAIVDRPDAFVIKNTGTYPLTITGYDFLHEESLFSWLESPPVLPLTIAPGEESGFALRFVAARADTDSLIFTTSAPESPLIVRLIGLINKEPDTVDVRAVSGSGYVGDRDLIGITAAFTVPTQLDIRYSLTMRYASGLLAPRGGMTGAPLPVSALAGTMSSEARWEHVAPGIVRVSGTVRGGSSSGRLVNIPMLVLAGPPARTELTIDSVAFVVTPSYVVRTGNGIYVGVDCDTGRGLVAKGRYELSQSAPNPSYPSAVIYYSVADHERVIINLYDPSGNLVKVLVDEVKAPGRYRLVIDATTIGSGTFTYEMISGPFRETRRMVVVE